MYAHVLTATILGGCASQTSTASPPTVDASPTKPTIIDPAAAAQAKLQATYEKREAMVPMRDGTQLFTSIYAPRDRSKTYPILFLRTPYSLRPYGPDAFPSKLGPSPLLSDSKYIFVYQDVRGAYMSQGSFVDMRPHTGPARSEGQTDESTDCYDTIEWLLQHVEGHNGRVGMWGISYPGFYAATGMIDAHPALKAVSPQAPIADWYFDDFHHHGAFFLPHAFHFLASFGLPRPAPTTERHPRFDHHTPDGYTFFMELGALRHADERYLKGAAQMWNDMVAHPNYDAFWQARNLLPHLKNVAPAVMTVGGWFDAEDLYGPLQIYRAIEANNPNSNNTLVMGPWGHGGWARTTGAALGNVVFGADTSKFYQEQIEFRFFEHYLKGVGESAGLPEAYVFETGKNRWRTFDSWPPRTRTPGNYYLGEQGTITQSPPTAPRSFDEFVSDPAHPVPYTTDITVGMTKAYMTDDQRFASRRADVLTFQTEVFTEPTTLAGPLVAKLWVSTSQTDADWVVKVIDVYPNDMPDPEDGLSTPDGKLPPGVHYGGYQQMVRSEVLRGRFRSSYSQPKPFKPNQPTAIELPLQDVLHTFLPGHRLMVQVQSTWFPLVDRNPQKYVDNIFMANDSDFVRATHRVYHSRDYPSHLAVSLLPAQPEPKAAR